MSFLALQQVSKRFGDTVVLEEISLEVVEGEAVVLLGPSGSGKTTLLRILAGFETPDAGSLLLRGRDLTREPPARRNFGMVFQHYALFPHLTVGQNVAFGLEARGKEEGVPARVAEALELVDLVGFETRRIHEISGGQQQRVALARALAPKPEVLLLDEPLSNLDPGLREKTRTELVATLSQVGITAIWVTHEQEEAFDVGSRVAVLNRGRLEQVGAPEELYSKPRTPFVAGFVGRASFLNGRLAGEHLTLLGANGQTEVSWPVELAADTEFSEAADPGDLVGRDAEVVALFRPEALELAPADGLDVLRGRVTERRFIGAATLVSVELEHGGRLEVAAEAQPGEAVGIRPRPGSRPLRVFLSPKVVGV